MSTDLTPAGDAAVRLALTVAELQREVARLHAGIVLALETTHWDRPYDTRIKAIQAELEELL